MVYCKNGNVCGLKKYSRWFNNDQKELKLLSHDYKFDLQDGFEDESFQRRRE